MGNSGFPRCPLCIYETEAGLGEEMIMVPVSEKGCSMWMCLSGEHRVTSNGLEVKKEDVWVKHKRE